MTAFGRAEMEAEGRTYTCEVRSLNNRYLDVSIRLPRRYGILEEKVKRLVTTYVTRGRVELTIQVNGAGEASPQKIEVNLGLAKQYHEQLDRLRGALGIKEQVGLSAMLGLRDLFEFTEEEEGVEQVWERISRPVEAALAALDAMRLEEGNTLAADFTQRLDALSALLATVESRAPGVVEDYRRRLTERIQAALQAADAQVDETRLIQEVAMFADRADVTEEMVRARSHIEQFRAMLGAEEPVGRKLNFLLQEMGREVNTIGSKAPDAGISQVVVEAKSELERLREQVQNIE